MTFILSILCFFLAGWIFVGMLIKGRIQGDTSILAYGYGLFLLGWIILYFGS